MRTLEFLAIPAVLKRDLAAAGRFLLQHPAPHRMAELDEQLRTASVAFVRTTAVISVFSALLWWPLDFFLFDSPEILAAFAAWRLVVIILGAALVIALSGSRWARRHVNPMTAVAFIVGGHLIAARMSDVGGLEESWFQAIYLAPFAVCTVLLPLAWRAVFVSVFIGGATLTFFGLHPEHLQNRAAGTILGFLAFSALAGIFTGHVIYVLSRRFLYDKMLQVEANDTLQVHVAEQTAELRRLAIHLQRAREAEQIRISRDLHDQIGQSATALRYDLEHAIDRLPDSPQQARTALEGTIETLATLHRDLRRIISTTRPAVLDHLGLVPALQWLVDGVRERTSLDAKLDVEVGLPEVSHDVATAIFRVAQESLTNVIRHASANSVVVRLAKRGTAVLLEIHDNGKGIDTPRSHVAGVGVIGMRERTTSVGGHFVITAEDGGTRVAAEIPIG